MTRGGKRDERREEPEEGPAPSAADEGAMASSGGNQLEELTSMMKSFMQTQAVRDKQQEKEHSRQELRWRNMEHQFRQIQAQVTEMREEQQQEQAGGEEQRASGVRYEEDQGEMDRSGHRIEPGTQESGRKVPVLINGQREEALVDSGSFQTVVRASLVPREQWADEKADIGCVHGDVRPYPTAEVYLTVGGQTFLLSVALVPQLPYPVILGLDVPTLLDLVQDPQKQSPLPTVCDEVLEIPGEPEPLQVKSGENSGTEVKECHVVTRAQSARNTLSELPFYEAELEVGVEKLRRSRVQKRRDTFLGAPREKDEIPQPSPPLDVDIPLNVGELQRKDPTLQRWFQKVSKVDGVSQGSAGCLEEVTYMIEKGILYQCQEPVSQHFFIQAAEEKEVEEQFFPTSPAGVSQ
ncbi:uncharacterized protein LOC114153287 [Xyrichtys novacula]|uniref:Uncharacterized protein LOC114153287 n=1 Tax=Xyrichtys novacula TaxID=13765 RepID=A0AAV1FSX4_XYRNO|nr:uncharacterized protein LOC114153287 [Xyrichtys novacula]